MSLVLLAAAILPATAVAETGTWATVIGGPGKQDTFRGLEANCANDGFILAGQTPDAGGKQDTLLTWVDFNGTITNQTRIGAINNDVARDMKVDCTDGSIYLAGLTTSNGFGGNDFFAARIDGSGNVNWSKVFGSPKADVAHGVDVLNGEVFVAGFTTDIDKDFYVAKLNSTDGTIICENTWSSVGEDVLREITVLEDGSAVVTGFQGKTGGRTGDVGVALFDNDCGWQWHNRYGGSWFEETAIIINEGNGTILVAEETKSFTSSQAGWLLRLNATNGSILRQATVNGPNVDEISDAQLVNGTLYFAGEHRSSSTTKEDFWVGAVNATTFDILWQTRQGSAALDEAERLLVTNSSIILTGHTDMLGNRDILVMSLGIDGNLGECSKLSTVDVPALTVLSGSFSNATSVVGENKTTSVNQKDLALNNQQVSLKTTQLCG